ncbi:MAG: hypothetical protein FVQ80_04090 [Planctomycetes bacterium]|nr:hypothetical protein [Planctomycetota bacterium]
MKTKRYMILSVAMLACLLMCTEQAIGMASRSRSAFLTNDKDVLHRVQGVQISIALSGVAQKHGLTKEALQTDVELRLRQSGIPILGVITENGKMKNKIRQKQD